MVAYRDLINQNCNRTNRNEINQRGRHPGVSRRCCCNRPGMLDVFNCRKQYNQVTIEQDENAANIATHCTSLCAVESVRACMHTSSGGYTKFTKSRKKTVGQRSIRVIHDRMSSSSSSLSQTTNYMSLQSPLRFHQIHLTHHVSFHIFLLWGYKLLT